MIRTQSLPNVALLIFVLALTATAVATAEECTRTIFGDGVSIQEVSSAAEILASPADWEGKTVRIEGEVQEVCQAMGCWMEIIAGDQGATLRVKVEDGVIVFPTAARGQRAIVQGTVEVQEMTAEKWEKWQRHLAMEQGEEFDPATLGEGPFSLIQVHGTGAEICV